MSPNRFGSPRFPQGGSFSHHNNNNIINETPNSLSYLGKPSNNSNTTMNFDVDYDDDEYLKSVVTIDEKSTQKFVTNNSSSSSSSPPQSSVTVNLNGIPSNSSSSKVVDEVWKDIVQQNHGNFGENGKSVQMQQQQPHTLGDQAFEEYLVHSSAINAGNNQNIVVNHQPLINVDQMVAVSQPQPDWLQFQTAQDMGVMGCLPVSGSLFGNSLADVGYPDNPDNQLSLSLPMPMNVTPSLNTQVVAERKRRFSDEMMEKTIARRQKRMFKNRESAARSRAKKQAYINKLEFEGAQLTKKIKFLMEEKENDMLLRSDPKRCPKYQLRRTTSADF